MNISKIFESHIAEAVIDDMMPTSDPSQYGNQAGLSTQHYLINMINRILTCLDKPDGNQVNAVLAELVDWNQAFDRQCPKLGVNSFIENGVRKSLIPVLVNYFQNRRMTVKWHGKYSTVRTLPGGGPQGCYLGGLEYSSQSNDSAQFVPAEDRYNVVDDLSLLEIINLLTVGLSSYNFKNHVASDIGIDDHFLSPENSKSQDFLNKIQHWTNEKKMCLNKSKTKVMIFNYSHNYQFSTRLYIENELLELVKETKLLGTIITSDLSWWENTNYLCKKGYQRMAIIRKLYEFNVPVVDLVQIYTLFIRSILEFNSCVWNFNLTQEQSNDLERVQKVSCKIILKEQYTSYHSALQLLDLKELSKRRIDLCTKFAKKCVQKERSSSMFPVDENRQGQKYKVNFAKHSRLLNSAIPQMQRILNE